MKKKRILYSFIFILIFVLGYLATAYFYPRYSARFPLFAILVLIDLYLWMGIKKLIINKSKLFKKSLQIAYWFPLTAFIISLILSSFDHVPFWNDDIRTLVFGLFFAVYAAKLIPFIFYLIADFLSLFNRQKQHIQKKTKGLTRKNFLKTLGLAGGGVMLATLFTGVFKWAYAFRVRTIKVKLQGAPSNLDGLRIIQLSDIHLGSWIEKNEMDRAIDLVMEQKPDIILFTGDLVNFRSLEALPFKEKFKRFKAPLGVYCILGNHDYGDYMRWPSQAAKENNMQILKDFYKEIGWDLLLNENRIIQYNGSEFALLGVQNWSKMKEFPKLGNLKEAIKGCEHIKTKILMSHDPTHWHYVVREEWPDIQLTLSGHTHGFQFGVETAHFRWSPSQWIYPEWGGLYSANEKSQYLYVNRGLGTIGYPGRVGILPEITLLNIDSEDNSI